MKEDREERPGLDARIEELTARLNDAEAALEAIRAGEVDALLVTAPDGDKVFTLRSADQAYRFMIEQMQQGAATLTADGTVFYCNRRLAEILGSPLETIIGAPLQVYVDEGDLPLFQALVTRGMTEGAAGELALRSAGNAFVPAYLTLSPLPIEGASGACLVVTDLTAQKRNEELVASEGLTRSILEQAAEAIIVVDETGMVLRANQAAHDLCGVNPILQPFESAFPMRVSDKPLPPQDPAGVGASAGQALGLSSVLSGDGLRRAEGSLQAADGNRIELLVSSHRLIHPSGKTRGWVVTLTDVTERKAVEARLRMKRESLALLFDSVRHLLSADSPKAVMEWLSERVAAHIGLDVWIAYLLDDECRPEVTAASGISAEEPSGREILALGEELCERAARVNERIVVGRISDEREPGGRLLDRLGVESFVCLPLETGGRVEGILAFGRRNPPRFEDKEIDLVQAMCGQASLMIERLRLLAESKERAAALDAANQSKDAFLAMLSHELRNPLSTILASLEILRLGSADEPMTKKVTGLLERQVGHLVRIVDDLMDVSRITRMKVQLRLQAVDLRGVVAEVVEGLRAEARERRHTIDVSVPSVPLFVLGDPTRLQQIIFNLLNNAIKYTAAGGRIWIAATHEGERLVLSVRDNGVGIPHDLLPHIFDLFSQAERTLDRSQGGLGIGLTLVRALVELHGGTVHGLSKGAGQGSEFVVTLPAHEPDASSLTGATATAAEEFASSDSRRVLLVEDNPDGLEAVAVLLRSLGHEVRTARDGPTALQDAAVHPPEVVLLDIGLPGMDGYEVARKLREARGDGMTVVALTGYGFEEDRRRSREAGFDHHLVKPVGVEDLRRIIGGQVPPMPQTSAESRSTPPR